MAGASVDLLRRVPLFSDLDDDELEQIAPSFKERTFDAGAVIAEEGKGGVGFFVIEDGTAKITVRGEERATVGPGGYFGEIALIDDGPRTATVTAEGELRCYGLTSWEFRPLVEANSTIAWKLLQAMAKMFRASQRET
jgi:CRP/FNR family cyclic AMP-dependent transcriptional regulator